MEDEMGSMNEMNDMPERFDEINLGQILDFFVTNWEQLLAGGAIGLLLGLGYWVITGSYSYKAETVLINNGAIDFLAWRNLQNNLPILALQMVDAKQVKPEDEPQMKKMASPKWWEKNVVPTFSLSKKDTKDLANISKDLQESGGSNILNLVVKNSDSSKGKAMTNLAITTQFIQRGSALLSLKNLINSYEAESLNVEADMNKKITDSEVELKYLNKRAINLETLRQRFPGNVTVTTQQVVELNDSNAKFMPINAQLVAVSSEINNINESLARMRDKLAQTKIQRAFLAQAISALAKQSDGLVLADKLLQIESALRQQIVPNDMSEEQALNSIFADLVSIRTRFTKGLEANLTPFVTKLRGPATPAAVGLFGGAILMVLVLFIRKAWLDYHRPGIAQTS
jgi:hypothetical protein